MKIKDINWHDNFIIHSDNILIIKGFLRSDFPEIIEVVFWDRIERDKVNDPNFKYNGHYLSYNGNFALLEDSPELTEEESKVLYNTLNNYDIAKLFQNKYNFFKEWFINNEEGYNMYMKKYTPDTD